jgi:hypothetical protein
VFDLTSIPKEVTDAAELVTVYAKQQNWQHWALYGICSRDFREAEMRELERRLAAISELARTIVHQFDPRIASMDERKKTFTVDCQCASCCAIRTAIEHGTLPSGPLD